MSYSQCKAAADSLRSLRVLIVEHNMADVELCLRELRKADFDVSYDVCQTLEEFKEFVALNNYDVVLSDYALPGWTGMEVLKLLKEKEQGIPFILVTGSLGEEAAVECMKKGATDYVTKDRLSRLVVSVNQVLEEKLLRDEKARAEDAIKRSQEWLQAIFEASRDGIVVEQQGVIVFANRAYAKLCGYSEAETVIGKESRLLLAGYDLVNPPTLGKDETPEGHRMYEFEGRRADGSVIDLEASVSQAVIAGQTYTISVVRDITERKKLEEQFLGAQKMEAVGRLAGGVAHDFNNMLTAIIGYCSLVMNSLEQGKQPSPREIEEIRKAGTRAASLTKQLLAFSRRQVLQARVLDLNVLIRDLEAMMRRLIGEDIELICKLKPDLGNIKADPGQIEQVIVNLIVNSRDAMARGGTIFIQTDNTELDDSYGREHVAVKPGPYVLLSLSDTGCGMDRETQSHLFEPFFTTKEKGKGTGLGLSTVYGIVKQSGGFVWAYSEVGKGSTFKIYLPRVEEKLPEVQSLKPQPELKGGTETILVVEDEEAVLAMVREILLRGGYTVLHASNAEAALHLATNTDNCIQLLLTDVVLPGLGGPELFERVVLTRPNLKVLYMSGYTDDVIFRQSLLEAHTAFIQKPFGPRDLAAKVREVLDQ